MLASLDQRVTYCLASAGECRRKADNHPAESELRNFWLEQEHKWFRLSQAYEHQIRTSTFILNVLDLSEWKGAKAGRQKN
jgi:hypothetical protein